MLSSRKIVVHVSNISSWMIKKFFSELQERKRNTIYEDSLVGCAYNETFTF